MSAAAWRSEGVSGLARSGGAVRLQWTARSRESNGTAADGEAVTPSPRTRGPLLGPGPVAETFPEPLTRLEQDLWVPPLRDGVAAALTLVASCSRRTLRRSPVITVVHDRVVADLELLGHWKRPRSLFARIDPRPPGRRLAAAWRVGRLKAAFAGLAADLVRRTDEELGAVPALSELEDITLARALDRTGLLLRALHSHEVLAGLLLDTGEATAASAALRALATARADGLDDRQAVLHDPVILALVPPSIGRQHPLPPVGNAPSAVAVREPGTGAAELREALRLRVRWVQELGARIALELGARAVARGALPDAAAVRHLRRAELDAVIGADLVLIDLESRAPVATGRPLPAAFRLAADGSVVADVPRRVSDHGSGVAPGKGRGPVHTGTDWPPDGAVLVVPALDPRLASFLPVLSAVVSETGTELSHVAIVAREMGVPVVVGVHDAANRFEAGTVLEVDGDTGAVVVVEGEE